MIGKIALLQNIGQFDSVSPNQNTVFNRLTLIYAENGRGKTTLANILRSLSINNPSLINERRRLGAVRAPKVVVDANSQQYVFQSNIWSNSLTDITVFDDNFVAQNVCSGIEIESGHRQNLHELILGARGVALNDILKSYVEKIEEHNRALKVKEAAIPVAERGSLTVDTFCTLPKREDIEAEIQVVERNLAAALDSEMIKQQVNFLSFELPAFDIEGIEKILQSDLPELQADAATQVQRHLSKLGKGAEAWIGEGIQRIQAASVGENSEVCPFCAQGLQNSSVITHYEAYFSEGYATLKRTITDYGKDIAANHGGDVQTAFERAVRLAVQGCEFWRKFMDVPIISIDTAEIARAWKAAREPILAILRTKLASPLEKMTLPSEIIDAVATYDTHRKTVAGNSHALVACNSQIALIKEKVAAANIAILNGDLTKLKAIRSRHSTGVEPLCLAYLEEKKAKKQTESLRDKARKDLDQYRSNIFGQYEAAINSYLQKFNVGFRLASIAPQNHRGGSSCTYNVLINNESVPLTADSGPAFKNTLSAGDRNTLALAFFFASLDQDPALAQKIVVIDDPMTSLDEHRTLATVQEIQELVKQVRQVVVLSHSKPFLCQLWEGADKVNRSALNVIRHKQSSFIDIWDVHQDCITEHDKRHVLIQDYIDGSSTGKGRDVAIALRYVLEAFLRVSYPRNFPPGKLLGKFHNECEQGLAAGSPILSQADANELKKLTDYANKFHHDTNPAYATVTINDQELFDHCSRTLAFARRT